MQFHPVANIFPMMSAEEFDALKADIAKHGQREPIYVWQGQIIDGRNRYKACEDLGVMPITRQWNGEGSLVEFVVSLNLHRRHLSQSQKAMVAVNMLPAIEAEARERQLATLKQNTVVANLPQRDAEPQAKSRDRAGAIMGVSGRMVSDAKTLIETAPDLWSFKVFPANDHARAVFPGVTQMTELQFVGKLYALRNAKLPGCVGKDLATTLPEDELIPF